jgi:hypothetical protein
MEECDRFKGEIDTFNQAIRCVSNKTWLWHWANIFLRFS